MSEQAREPRRYLRAIVLSVLAAFLVWQVITRTFVAYLANVAPETALTLAPTNPDALLNLADKRLAEGLETARQSKTAGTSPGGLFTYEVTAPAGSSSAPPQSPHAAAFNDQLRTWAEVALVNDPTNARALRILGQLAAACMKGCPSTG